MDDYSSKDNIQINNNDQKSSADITNKDSLHTKDNQSKILSEPFEEVKRQVNFGLSLSEEVKLEAFRQVCEHYRQDIRMFWAGASFYIIIHGGLLSVFTKITVPFMQLLMSTFGILAAIYWWKAAKGVIFFMTKWRDLMIELNDILQNNDGWYSRGARMVNTNINYIPAHITKNIALSVGVLWCIAAIYSLDQLMDKLISGKITELFGHLWVFS